MFSATAGNAFVHIPRYVGLAWLDEFYRHMNGIPFRVMDGIIDNVCILCLEREKAGFVEGVKVGIQLHREFE